MLNVKLLREKSFEWIFFFFKIRITCTSTRTIRTCSLPSALISLPTKKSERLYTLTVTSNGFKRLSKMITRLAKPVTRLAQTMTRLGKIVTRSAKTLTRLGKTVDVSRLCIIVTRLGKSFTKLDYTITRWGKALNSGKSKTSLDVKWENECSNWYFILEKCFRHTSVNRLAKLI
jgi:hypothetical protein